MFRVKAVTSSVYENCSGSSEAGNTRVSDQLLKTLTEDAVRATAVIQAAFRMSRMMETQRKRD